jgi:hypothetical protein
MNTPTNTSKLALALFLASAAVSGDAAASTRMASEQNPKIMVPSPTPPANAIAGCWTADRILYGYRLSFCVESDGDAKYTVTGKGLYCHAGLGWRQSWGSYGFTMRRTSCGRGMDWTADSFTCVLRTDGHGGYGGYGRIAVPSGRLECTYWPAVFGYLPTSFSARRV